jgi:hypothetical protein
MAPTTDLSAQISAASIALGQSVIDSASFTEIGSAKGCAENKTT